MKHFGHTFSNEDAGYAMTTASQHSRFKFIKLLPRQEVKDEMMVSDTSAEKGILLEDVMGIEDDGTNIYFVRKRSIDDTSESKKQCEKDMSIENLSKHFGRPLADAAKSFGGMFYITMFLHFYISAFTTSLFFLFHISNTFS